MRFQFRGRQTSISLRQPFPSTSVWPKATLGNAVVDTRCALSPYCDCVSTIVIMVILQLGTAFKKSTLTQQVARWPLGCVEDYHNTAVGEYYLNGTTHQDRATRTAQQFDNGWKSLMYHIMKTCGKSENT